MGLSLLAGPANAGKVALLLERYLGALESDPFLIVPNRPDVDRAERELLRRTGALVGGSIGTFDDLFTRIAHGNGARRRVVTEAQRTLLLRRVVARARGGGLGRSARFGGFADALGTTVAELESALIEPGELEGELSELYGAYRDELDRLELWDRELERRYAAERVANELEAWEGRPVFAYGFEDLTGAEWALLEALAGRSEVTVSLPYEPGRDAFASLARTSNDLNALAETREERPANPRVRTPVLAHVERALFAGDSPTRTALDGSLRFLEGAGLRGTIELVAEEVLALLRTGTPAEEIAIVAAPVDRWRAGLNTAFATLGIPYALEGRIRLGQTPFGQALLALLRYLWLEGDRRDLFAFLRSPYSGLPRAHADFLEGRLRGRAVNEPARVEEEVRKLRPQPLPHLEALRSAEDPFAAVTDLARAMIRAAYGLEAPPTGETARLDLVREAASDDGAPREPSPFWDEACGLSDPAEVERWTRRRPLSALTWPLEGAPTERERLRALASLSSVDEGTARALARANGWERRLERALAAFDRPTRLNHPAVLEELRQKACFSVTDLERLVRREAESPLPLVPDRFEVSFGSERSAPELQRGLDLGGFTVSGKIDRIDVDPLSARGIVQDYKSGKTAYSAAKIESELRLQIPLYMLVLRDLIGIEPLGGLYRALAGDRQARGLLRASARDDVLPGFTRTDYKDDDEFWAQVDGAVGHARRFVERIRAGDVRHDPLGDAGCPSWCELYPMCRVKRT